MDTNNNKKTKVSPINLHLKIHSHYNSSLEKTWFLINNPILIDEHPDIPIKYTKFKEYISLYLPTIDEVKKSMELLLKPKVNPLYWTIHFRGSGKDKSDGYLEIGLGYK